MDENESLVQALIAASRSPDESVRLAALADMAAVVSEAQGDEGLTVGQAFRVHGGVKELALALVEPTPFKLQALLVLANLCSAAVDASSAQTKSELLACCGAQPITACLHSEDEDVLVMACGLLQNLCHSQAWARATQKHGGVPEALLSHPSPLVVQYASGAWTNIVRCYEAAGEPTPALSSSDNDAARHLETELSVESMRRRHAYRVLSRGVKGMSAEARLRRLLNARERPPRARSNMRAPSAPQSSLRVDQSEASVRDTSRRLRRERVPETHLQGRVVSGRYVASAAAPMARALVAKGSSEWPVVEHNLELRLHELRQRGSQRAAQLLQAHWRGRAARMGMVETRDDVEVPAVHSSPATSPGSRVPFEILVLDSRDVSTLAAPPSIAGATALSPYDGLETTRPFVEAPAEERASCHRSTFERLSGHRARSVAPPQQDRSTEMVARRLRQLRLRGSVRAAQVLQARWRGRTARARMAEGHALERGTAAGGGSAPATFGMAHLAQVDPHAARRHGVSEPGEKCSAAASLEPLAALRTGAARPLRPVAQPPRVLEDYGRGASPFAGDCVPRQASFDHYKVFSGAIAGQTEGMADGADAHAANGTHRADVAEDRARAAALAVARADAIAVGASDMHIQAEQPTPRMHPNQRPPSLASETATRDEQHQSAVVPVEVAAAEAERRLLAAEAARHGRAEREAAEAAVHEAAERAAEQGRRREIWDEQRREQELIEKREALKRERDEHELARTRAAEAARKSNLAAAAVRERRRAEYQAAVRIQAGWRRKRAWRVIKPLRRAWLAERRRLDELAWAAEIERQNRQARNLPPTNRGVSWTQYARVRTRLPPQPSPLPPATEGNAAGVDGGNERGGMPSSTDVVQQNSMVGHKGPSATLLEVQLLQQANEHLLARLEALASGGPQRSGGLNAVSKPRQGQLPTHGLRHAQAHRETHRAAGSQQRCNALIEVKRPLASDAVQAGAGAGSSECKCYSVAAADDDTTGHTCRAASKGDDDGRPPRLPLATPRNDGFAGSHGCTDHAVYFGGALVGFGQQGPQTAVLSPGGKRYILQRAPSPSTRPRQPPAPHFAGNDRQCEPKDRHERYSRPPARSVAAAVAAAARSRPGMPASARYARPPPYSLPTALGAYTCRTGRTARPRGCPRQRLPWCDSITQHEPSSRVRSEKWDSLPRSVLLGWKR